MTDSVKGRALLALLDQLENVFDADWEYTKSALSFGVANGGTFLNPSVADEANNWANRAALLAAYRHAKDMVSDRYAQDALLDAFAFYKTTEMPEALVIACRQAGVMEDIKNEVVGWAPDAWDALSNHIGDRSKLSIAGLSSGPYDSLRDSLVVPVNYPDANGDIIGLWGCNSGIDFVHCTYDPDRFDEAARHVAPLIARCFHAMSLYYSATLGKRAADAKMGAPNEITN